MPNFSPEQKINLAIQMEHAFDYVRWNKAVPFIPFPVHWQIQVVPPVRGTIVTFNVKLDGMRRHIQVLLDGYGLMGYSPQPIWMVRPDCNESMSALPVDDTEGLIRVVESALKAKMKRERGDDEPDLPDEEEMEEDNEPSEQEVA
jgi:hypothetical protein